MDITWLRWNILLSLGLFVSPTFTSTVKGGYRRYATYMLQPGQTGAGSRTGGQQQQHSINMELTASYNSQVRTRRMGTQLSPGVHLHQQHQPFQSGASSGHQQLKPVGVNVCGGRCCQGWSLAPGSQRCTKPNCSPKCQNGGMCLSPQLCMCKPGTKGKACEQKAGTTSPAMPMPGNGQDTFMQQRPIPQQSPQHTSQMGSIPQKVNSLSQMTLTLKQQPGVPQQAQPQLRPSHPLSMTVQQIPSQQFLIKPKYYQTQKVYSGVQPAEGALPLSAGHSPVQGHSMSNHTGRIKVVFTPTICKVTCIQGNCQNTCEKGNTTTLISENGHAADTLTAPNFRVVVCHLPCMNGGQCSARDKCQCPPNFTGKLCHIPVQNGHHGQQQHQSQVSLSRTQGGQVQSTHTLPLLIDGQNGIQMKFPPNVVNIHVKHPPEASVQIHQVSQMDNPNVQKAKGAQPGQVTYHNLGYTNQQSIFHHYPVSSKSLGRCFQETTGALCGKAFPGLSKQEDCCGTVGTSWGFNKCQKCPKKPSIPVTGSRQQHIDCPVGYKRINITFCADINECQLQGVCPNGECLNTIGSYRCSCKAGYMPDPTLSTCIPDNSMIPEEKGFCFRFVSAGKQCLHPVPVQLSKQLCCCSVGKAWGPHCEKCPIPGTAAFKEICPGGMGYTVVGTYKKVNAYPNNLPDTDSKIRTSQPVPVEVPAPVPADEEPVEALTSTERHQVEAVALGKVATAAPEEELIPLDNNDKQTEPGQPQLSPGISTINLDQEFPVVIERTSPPPLIEVAPEISTSSASQVIAPTQVTEVNECVVNPDICGAGYCHNLPVGYTCLCNPGFHFHTELGTCVDVNECEQSPQPCSNGRCFNTEGSFLCECLIGFMTDEEGTHCIDVDECLRPGTCGDGHCTNTVGSYRCEYCESGFKMSRRGHCEDINECQDDSVCSAGQCVNFPGSYECIPCHEGFEGKRGQCVDVNECSDSSFCANGKCENLEGSYACTCNTGFETTPDGKLCQDVDECTNKQLCVGGHCRNTEGSFLCTCNSGFRLSASRDQCEDVDECASQQVCVRGRCENTEGSFLCTCNNGFKLSASRDNCEDIDECAYDHLCVSGNCQNTEGSFLCTCSSGFRLSATKHQCEDIDECREQTNACQDNSICFNSVGSYTCMCPEGYERIHETSCRDIDECSSDEELCQPHGECVNNEGSFSCVCEQGFLVSAHGQTCEDVDECAANNTLCGSHGFCENTVGSFRCLCDQGFQDSHDDRGCVDVNECEKISGVCGEALCENVEGAFLCICPDDNQEYDTMTGQCTSATPSEPSEERKDCYYNLSDANLCDNVLTSNFTKEECCCTLGAGWGDNCEIFPCPVLGTGAFSSLCPKGKGFIPNEDSVDGVTPQNYKDANECDLFEAEICKNGVCVNTEPGFECYCKLGHYYDATKLDCIDIDECTDSSVCIDGQCVNTDGSYNCFCTHPLVFDFTLRRCIDPTDTTEHNMDVFQDICWQKVSQDMTCNEPLIGKQTTYTECCCLYGLAWGPDCALCPKKTSEDHAMLCNIPFPGNSRRYGQDALIPPDYSESNLEYDANADADADAHAPGFLPLFRENEQYDAFEGLQAEECGILNGCENGRCVRVQEGYTCDCFDGYHLDMSKMACVDVNECTELNDKMSLCRNAKCVNTEGSYKCICLPGFVRSEQSNYCVASKEEHNSEFE
ncbi:latent-transforming growth factor beta-binding protein 1 isoform X5 [Polypterus senegalus]|uniref:latent-transforming growth factor beta-binding protein 1 isoform X5 n=1 Tax=Polypterus senegalus TaxID=55291 RepID=UPI001966CB45|nr:latent-transforming growth factor beta-binding protein 1 isoform X5 [Polypterus senegalus]